MKYLCVHCDKTFEHDDDAPKKARCPECLRVNGLEEVASAKPGEAQRPPWVMWAAAGAALVAAGVGYTLWAGEAADTVTGEVPLAPLEQDAVNAQLNARAVDARELGRMLVPSEAVSAWAEENTSGSTPAAKAESLLAAIRERAEAGAFERWSMGIPRDTPISGSDETLDALSEDGGRRHLYPLEVASLMAAGLRAVDVDAMVAEAIAFPGDRTPPDPSGQFGYYVVAVYPNGAGQGDPTFYDPYLGREVAPEDHRVLTDLQAIAAGLATRSLHLLSRESDPERAMEASSQSVRLDGRSPSGRAVRGAILLVAGQADQGLQELMSAKQLRSDAPRRNLLAGVHMAQGDLDAASREIAAALEQYPDFAPGRATLAAIHLSRGETDLARSELEYAERADPQLHLLPQLWAGYYASTGDLERAVERAEAAVEANPDLQTRLMAARIYRQAAQYDRMRREARAVLEMTPSQREPEIRALIRQMLGPTALEDPDEEIPLDDEPLPEDGEEDGLGLGDPSSLQLDSPSLGAGGDDGPSLLGGGDDDLQLGGGGGGLQLGGGGGGGYQLGGGGGGGGYRLNLGN